MGTLGSDLTLGRLERAARAVPCAGNLDRIRDGLLITGQRYNLIFRFDPEDLLTRYVDARDRWRSLSSSLPAWTLSRNANTRSVSNAAAAASYAGSEESAKRCSSPG